MAKSDYEDEISGVSALQGSGHENHEDVIPDLIMSLIMQTTQLLTLLQESDIVEFKLYKSRLAIWLNLITQLPKDLPDRKYMGFKVVKPKR